MSRATRAIRGAMKYPGSKFDSLGELLPLIPYKHTFVDVFGGGGCVLLSRNASKLDVYNDRHGGVTNFYRVLRDQTKALVERLEILVHSREEWEYCKATWEDPSLSDLERAARWFYLCQYSFLGKGHSFARVTHSKSSVAGTLEARLPSFWEIRMRLQRVQIENLSWEECFADYDSADTVFYLDPPYYGVDVTSYSFTMTAKDHIRMLDAIRSIQGTVVLSGYDNDLYNSYTWDQTKTWQRRDRANAHAISAHNNRTEVGARMMKTEKVWIKL